MSDTGLDVGRRMKARRIADQARKIAGGSGAAVVECVRKLTDGEWKALDILSRIDARMNHEFRASGIGPLTCVCGLQLSSPKHKPHDAPSPETRALVIEILSRPEAPDIEQCPARDEDAPPPPNQ